jgi:signal transduction histidine kinase
MLQAPVSRRTWAELAYALSDPLAGAVGFAFVTAICILGPVFIAVAGIPVTVGLACVRPLMAAERLRTRALLGVRLPRLPRPPARERGYLGWVRPAVADTAGWRAVAYLLLHLPYAVVVFSVAVAFWGGAFLCLSSPFWLESGVRLPDLDASRDVLLVAVGLVLLFAAPWAVRGAVSVSKLLLRLPLDPAGSPQRVRHLELARGRVIESSAAMLRRIERDLHDGAQARLVAMTMRLSVVQEQLAGATGPGADVTRELLEAVRRDATQAMAELRDLACGIRPPALDSGLGPAIESLAARSPVPVDLRVSITERPSAGIETIAYFCAAELLDNICKHSRADYACIEVAQHDRALLLQVSDNGVGGAWAREGSGLADLTGRVYSADGTLSVHSPPVGPTLVTIVLPFQVLGEPRQRGAAPPGLRSEERATREGGASKRPGGEQETQQLHVLQDLRALRVIVRVRRAACGHERVPAVQLHPLTTPQRPGELRFRSLHA